MSDLNSYTYRKLEPSEAGALVAKGGMAEVRGRKWGLTQLRAGGRAQAGASFPRNKDYTQKLGFAFSNPCCRPVQADCILHLADGKTETQRCIHSSVSMY